MSESKWVPKHKTCDAASLVSCVAGSGPFTFDTLMFAYDCDPSFMTTVLRHAERDGLVRETEPGVWDGPR